MWPIIFRTTLAQEGTFLFFILCRFNFVPTYKFSAFNGLYKVYVTQRDEMLIHFALIFNLSSKSGIKISQKWPLFSSSHSVVLYDLIQRWFDFSVMFEIFTHIAPYKNTSVRCLDNLILAIFSKKKFSSIFPSTFIIVNVLFITICCKSFSGEKCAIERKHRLIFHHDAYLYAFSCPSFETVAVSRIFHNWYVCLSINFRKCVVI